MRRPPSLVDHAVGGSYFAAGWELRITGRCLDEDLNADPQSTFDEVAGLEIVRALVRERKDKTMGGRQVSPIACRPEVSVVAHGHDHRGATMFDEAEEVVWLVAYRRHRSGTVDDFYPWCKDLAEGDRLLPTEADLERLLRERDRRFVEAVAVEAPLLLHRARSEPGEHRHAFGGELPASIAVEVIDEPEAQAITIAFRLDVVPWDQVEIMLAAFHPLAEWEMIERMPSRDLEGGEVAMTVVVGES